MRIAHVLPLTLACALLGMPTSIGALPATLFRAAVTASEASSNCRRDDPDDRYDYYGFRRVVTRPP